MNLIIVALVAIIYSQISWIQDNNTIEYYTDNPHSFIILYSQGRQQALS